MVFVHYHLAVAHDLHRSVLAHRLLINRRHAPARGFDAEMRAYYTDHPIQKSNCAQITFLAKESIETCGPISVNRGPIPSTIVARPPTLGVTRTESQLDLCIVETKTAIRKRSDINMQYLDLAIFYVFYSNNVQIELITHVCNVTGRPDVNRSQLSQGRLLLKLMRPYREVTFKGAVTCGTRHSMWTLAELPPARRTNFLSILVDFGPDPWELFNIMRMTQTYNDPVVGFIVKINEPMKAQVHYDGEWWVSPTWNIKLQPSFTIHSVSKPIKTAILQTSFHSDSPNGLETVEGKPSGALKYVTGKNNRWSTVDVTNCLLDIRLTILSNVETKSNMSNLIPTFLNNAPRQHLRKTEKCHELM
ncbi:hypothetical protein B5X24_HaOG201794 [Helicoverpa armigera]|nr:hypothetical protein B5X24_HaOG201794 [Helicoverpa armigera]